VVGAARTRPQQPQSAEGDVDDRSEHDVEDQVGHEDADRTGRQVAAVDDAVGDHPEHPKRREVSRRRAVNHHQPHQHRVDPIPSGEGHADGRDDRHGRGAQRAKRDKDPAEHEHHPRQRGHPTPDRADRTPDEPVDRAVPFRDGEQVRDPDQDHEQICGKAGQHLRCRGTENRRADGERADKGEDAQVDRPHGAQKEDADQNEDRDEVS
jgi:hypothetical protein